jgi:ABC-type branched-subunit amino acid transport system substrate-binding protein
MLSAGRSAHQDAAATRREVAMRDKLVLLGTMAAITMVAGLASAQDKPIRIGVNTAIQVQVGRDAIDAVRMAIGEINEQGGVLGNKLEAIVADEGEAATEGPKVGIAAVNKLTGEDRVNVLIGGYDSGVTLGELPHISRAKTIFLGIGSASPSIQQKVKDDYEHYKYIFCVNPINSAKQANALIDFIRGKLKGELDLARIAILGENAKWVQDMVPLIKKGSESAGLQVPISEFFDVQTADFSPIFAKIKDSGAVPRPDHLPRRLGRLRQAMVRRQGPGTDRRNRREKHGRELLRAGRRQIGRRSIRELRRARAVDANHGRLVGQVREAVQPTTGLYRAWCL